MQLSVLLYKRVMRLPAPGREASARALLARSLGDGMGIETTEWFVEVDTVRGYL
jgi:hypothetical protein